MSRIIKPDSRENKTTIQVTKELKERLTKLGSKSESYNQIITKLIDNFQEHNLKTKELTRINNKKQEFGQIKIAKNITFSKYERVTISIIDKIDPDSQFSIETPTITLEITYNKPIKREDKLYQIDLKINKIIFDNEVYSPKEFFGLLQKDIVYCEQFIYYYLKSILEIIKIEFKKSNFFFKNYDNYFELARWRTFLLNSKLSPEILSNDVEVVLSDLKNEKTNKKLIKDVKDSYYNKIRDLGGYKSLWKRKV